MKVLTINDFGLIISFFHGILTSNFHKQIFQKLKCKTIMFLKNKNLWLGAQKYAKLWIDASIENARKLNSQFRPRVLPSIVLKSVASR